MPSWEVFGTIVDSGPKGVTARDKRSPSRNLGCLGILLLVAVLLGLFALSSRKPSPLLVVELVGKDVENKTVDVVLGAGRFERAASYVAGYFLLSCNRARCPLPCCQKSSEVDVRLPFTIGKPSSSLPVLSVNGSFQTTVKLPNAALALVESHELHALHLEVQLSTVELVGGEELNLKKGDWR